MTGVIAQIVRINVGGTTFTTSRDTLLQPGTMLAAMFGGQIGNTQDGQGAFFIDRDPKHFPSVLAYLRDGVCTLPESHSDKLELMRDAQFYGIEGLVTEMEAATGGYVSGLQQRILHAILARPELRCMSDYIMKQAFNEDNISPGHLCGVAVCLSCKHDAFKIRSSTGIEASEMVIHVDQGRDKYEEASHALRWCCQYKWLLPSYIDTLKLGLKVLLHDSQVLSQSCCMSLQLYWTHCQILQSKTWMDFEKEGQIVPAWYEQMKGALLGRFP